MSKTITIDAETLESLVSMAEAQAEHMRTRRRIAIKTAREMIERVAREGRKALESQRSVLDEDHSDERDGPRAGTVECPAEGTIFDHSR